MTPSHQAIPETTVAIQQAAHRMFAEHAADAAFLVSGAGIVEHATAGASALLAKSQASLAGCDLRALIDAGDVSRLNEAIHSALAGNTAELVMVVRSTEGDMKPLHAKVFLAVDARSLWVVAFDLSKTSKVSTPTIDDPTGMVSAMPAALRAGEFVVAYQPIVLRDGSIKGCEALMRWRKPDGTYVPPVAFIPRAERNGFIVELGEFILRESLLQLRKFDASGLENLYMSVNVSPRQLEHPGFEEMVSRALADTDVAPRRLTLELTEGLAVVDPEFARARLGRIAASGVRIALDDYGTGYAGMSYLKCFPVSTVKIDRSFVLEIEDDEDEYSGLIVKAFVELTKSLGLETVAEGVETPLQAQLLRAMNVDLLQGYLFGRPMPPAELIATYGRPQVVAAS
ncbi:putative bifunctional diguanylate cyclase/phosphodiesterase [Burkholderia ubonensis]|uniref:putative bifunctional diguanylate cyclase/phosphodiesterase n=1 Tax=Burkholderia ubonensis TaxID=101571 RepID=UPI000752CF46|nr:EAL domain-containing protein [Burkholderia ubonensis]KVP39605.1 hypothetical protein WJ87_05055 [Burkholderia ubonensis]